MSGKGRVGGHSKSGQSVLWRKQCFQAWDLDWRLAGEGMQVWSKGKVVLGAEFLAQDRKQEEPGHRYSDPWLVATCTEVPLPDSRRCHGMEKALRALEMSSARLKQNVRATNLPKQGHGDRWPNEEG